MIYFSSSLHTIKRKSALHITMWRYTSVVITIGVFIFLGLFISLSERHESGLTDASRTSLDALAGLTQDAEPDGREDRTCSGHRLRWAGDWSGPQLLLEPRCYRDSDDVIFVYVHSSLSGSWRRKLIRDTWGNKRFYQEDFLRNLPKNVTTREGSPMNQLNFTVQVMFVVGLAEHQVQYKDALQPVLEESCAYEDILLVNYLDNYYNLTYKGGVSLNWITEHLPNVQFVLKADDDVMLNTYEWMAEAQKLRRMSSSNTITCCLWREPLVIRKGKWAVSRQDYQPDRYPDHCSGGAYLLTNLAVRAISRALDETQMNSLWRIDDVFFTGVLAEKVKVKRFHIGTGCKGLGMEDDFGYTTDYNDVTPTNFLMAHKLDLDYWDRFWYEVVHFYTNSTSLS